MPELFLGNEAKALSRTRTPLEVELAEFKEFGTATRCTTTTVGDVEVPTYTNEFWTARQRAAHSLHEISYRACFKPQLPRFFIDRLTKPGEIVYDPFSGRGTTALEAALAERVPWACDVNPLSEALVWPRLDPPRLSEVNERLASIPLDRPTDVWTALKVFYHAETLQQICALRDYFLQKQEDGSMDHVDRWIRMVALNRLTGHSSGFFSVYSLPPNQAVSIESQRKINAAREQTPPRRDVRPIISKKTRTLMADLTDEHRTKLGAVKQRSRLLTQDSRETPGLPSGSASLVVTSPPFLDIVNYKMDNWLRCWFIGVDPEAVPIMQFRRLADWSDAMTQGFREYYRLLQPGGYVAFEVGEVRNGTVRLEETVIACGLAAGLGAELVVINDQEFTKTSNAWGVSNRSKGTNTNRIVVFRKPICG